MKFRKILAAAIAGTLVFALGGCGNNSSSSQDENNSAEKNNGKTITIWAWDDNFNVKAANIAKDYYAKENPDVTVNVVSMAQKDIVQTLNTALSSGTYNGLPDIVLIEDYRIQNYITAYPNELRDLSDIVNPDDFMDYKIEVMKDGDKIYGVPFDSGVTALFYRTDYIEAAGYSVDDMQDITWDKYIEIGKAVKESTGKYMLSLDPSDLGQLRMMMQSSGEWYTDENGKVNIKDNEALKEAVKTYKKIIDSGISTQITGWDPFVAAFQKGDVASVPTGCWIAPTIAAADDQSGKWAVASLPKMADYSASTNYSNIGGASWYVLDNTGNGELAEDFLAKTFASDTDLMNELAGEINLVSTLKAAGNAENYSKPDEFFSGQEIFRDFFDWTAEIPAVNYGLYTYTIEDIMTEAVQSILQGADIDETFENTQIQAEAAAIS